MTTPGAHQIEKPSRLIFIVALVAAAAALVMLGDRGGRLPSGGWYEASRQRTLQADLQYRFAMFWEQIASRASFPGLGGVDELRERAVAEYEREALSPHPSARVLHRLGIIYGERGYPEQAQQALTRAATLDEAHASLYFALARVYGPPSSDRRHLPPAFAERLQEQESWLAALSLMAFYRAVGDTRQAETAREHWRQQVRLFGGAALLLMAVYGTLGLLGLCLVLVAIIRRGFLIAPPPPPRPPLMVPWEPLEVLEVVAALYFGIAFLGVSAGLLLHRTGLGHLELARVLITVLQYLLFSGVALALIWKRIRAPRSQRLRALGMRTQKLGRLIVEGVAGYGVLIVILVTLGLGSAPGWLAAVQSGENLVMATTNPTARLVLFLLICVIAPVLEELIFRGFVYAGLRRRMPLVGGVVASAMLFALMHNSLQALLPIGLIGVVLAVLYERNRSVLPSIICHALNNTFVFFLMLLAQ